MDPTNSCATLHVVCGLQGPVRLESVQGMYHEEPPPPYEESFQDRLVPTAPPAPDSPISAMHSEIAGNHAVCDIGTIAINISIASMPDTALRTQMVQETTVASQSSSDKRSKKRKFFDRLVLGSWLVFWPIYIPITILRDSPVDDDDFRKDVLLSEGYRICQKISN